MRVSLIAPLLLIVYGYDAVAATQLLCHALPDRSRRDCRRGECQLAVCRAVVRPWALFDSCALGPIDLACYPQALQPSICTQYKQNVDAATVSPDQRSFRIRLAAL